MNNPTLFLVIQHLKRESRSRQARIREFIVMSDSRETARAHIDAECFDDVESTTVMAIEDNIWHMGVHVVGQKEAKALKAVI
jgi:hypothetical protein